MVGGVSTLYHESTCIRDYDSHARMYYHSTAAQAATVARDAHAGKLVLGHFSARYEDESAILKEAETIFPNSFLANEGLVIDV